MPPERKYRLGDVLVDQGLISFSELTTALKKQKLSKQRLGKTLVDMNVVEERDVVGALSRQAVYNKEIDPNPASYNPVCEIKPLPLSEKLMRAGLTLGILVLLIIICIAVNGSTDAAYGNRNIDADKRPVIGTTSSEPSALTANITPIATLRQGKRVAPSEAPKSSLIRKAIQQALESSISEIGIYESALQKQYIFYSKTSLTGNTRREYLKDGWVHYQFEGATLAQDTKFKSSDDWLLNNKIKQGSTGVEWTFQLRNDGSAKFHELPPDTDNDSFRLVVVIRSSGVSSLGANKKGEGFQAHP